jgi:hypothetical protein
MDDEKLVHDIVRQVNDKQYDKSHNFDPISKEQDVEDAMKSHPADSDRTKGVYNDIDTKLKGDGFQEWPKYTDSTKQREA